VGGVICLIFGAIMLVDGPIPEMRVRLGIAIAVSVPIGLIAVFLMTLVVRARALRPANGSDAMIGQIGVTRTLVGPDGRVFVRGELWNARAKTEIAEGARVRVREVVGLRLVVEPE
jgi:membrane-bound serine protease (ClpP class)